MRVVAGTHRGRRLHLPPGSGTRPTADRVREALFSMLADVTGARVLDLFAGSGALGIEALSRGAAAGGVRGELAVGGRGGRAQPPRPRPGRRPCHRRDALAYLRGADGAPGLRPRLPRPPYDCAPSLSAPLAELVPAVLADRAVIVTESHKRTPLELPFPAARERTYGDTRLVDPPL
ncbi:MAG: RsmD family RNA methyltransferase [Thermoleophilaceae bacterium]